MKTILYPTDYSEYAVQALKYAFEISNKLGAQLVVLHVFDIPSFPGTTMISPLKQTRKRAIKEKHGLLKTYCKKHLGENLDQMNVEIMVAKNVSITEEISLVARGISADMVIIGMKDKYSKRGIFEGDIAKALITKLQCPLLIIPNNISTKTIQNIVYATDFEEDDIISIQKLAELGTSYQATIHIVHITSSKKEEDEEKMAWFKEMVSQKVSYPNIEYDVLVSDNIHKKLNDYIESLNADMISMLEREDRGIFRKLFHKDLVKQQESHSSVPLLSFKS